jgi:hypothetical protein
MALFLLKLFAGRDPALLPVTQNLSIRHTWHSPVPQETGRRAVADRMPPSVDDHVLDHTESAWPIPLIVPVMAEVR